MGNQPEQKFRAKGITATIWKNTGQKDGKEYSFYTVTTERSYKDKEGNWGNTTAMRVGDLPKVVLVVNQAYAWLMQEADVTED